MSYANFDEKVARDAVIFLNAELIWTKDVLHKIEEDKDEPNYDFISDSTVWDDIFVDEMNNVINKFVTNIHRINIQKAFVCIYDIINIRDNYRNTNNNVNIFSNHNRKVYHDNMKLYVKNFITMLSIFCPFWIERLKSTIDVERIFGELEWFKMKSVNGKGTWVKSTMFELVRQVKHKKQKIKRDCALEITVYTTYDNDIVGIVKRMLTEKEDRINGEIAKRYCDDLISTCKDNAMRKKIGMFSREALNNIEKYGAGWLDWVSCGQTYEFDMINEWVPKLVSGEFTNIKIRSQEISSSAGYGPGYPLFVLV